MIDRVAFLSVHTSPLAAPGSGDAGGMNVYVVSVARTFAASGIAVDVFTAQDDGYGPVTEISSGYRVIHVAAPGEDRAERIGAFAAGVDAWTSARGCSYDIIHSHYWLSAWAGILLEDPLRAPLVISFHTLGRVRDVGEGEPPAPLARIATETEVIAHAGCVVASTPAEAVDLVERYRALPERVCVSPPGVDHGLFHPAPSRRAELGLPSGPLAAVVGRIQPLKRIGLAIEAISAIDEAQLLVVGGPSGERGEEELSRLREIAAELAPGRIHFRPPFEHDSVADVFRSVDLVVVPSRTESFGLVAVESQACGTPVVAAAVGGLAHAVADGESGFLVEGDEPSDWAKRIGAVLFDEPMRDRMGAGAVMHASQFSWTSTAARLEELYRGLQ